MLITKNPNIRHFEITTDTSKKEFKSVSVFQRIACMSVKLNKTFMLCTFGSQHGKFLYDSAGSQWINHYSSKCVGSLGVKASNLSEVTEFMNKTYSLPSSNEPDISKRQTIMIPSQIHTLSQYLSIPRTTSNFCYFVTPEKPGGIYARKYWCPGCMECQEFNFLGCTTVSCGT